VSNIDPDITEDILKKNFKGNKKITLKETDDVPNLAYIEFNSLESAEYMINRFNGKKMGFFELVCELVPLKQIFSCHVTLKKLF
jgi:RNA recognition motif-containing protein